MTPEISKGIKTKEILPLEGRIYDPEEVERGWYDIWENIAAFQPEYNGPGRKRNGKPWCCIIPPPNITEQLHMGHGLNFTLQDIIVRIRRMEGYDVLWLPGIDHAGIATQVKVEKALEAEGTSREEIGYEAFIKRAWQWKEEKGGRILDQIRELGSSCDWTRLRFTLDPGPSKGIATAFKHLYDKGYIYRGTYMVNWSPALKSAISDLEVIYEEEQGALYYINYPFKDGKGAIQVATTRPETMLADTAVAVNPADERYKDMIGRIVIQPLSGVEMPVIGDDYVSPEFGTGALKITPAHDPNDYEVGKRHGLPAPNMLNIDGTLNDLYPPYKGLTVIEARKRAIEDLTKHGYLVKIEPYVHQVGHCQRSGCVVEPMISEQWFCKMTELVKPAIKAIQLKPDGTRDLTFYSSRWYKVYLDWLDPASIRDWCISRQLWWGHRIPAYYCDECGEITVSIEPPSKCSKCSSTELRQDPDVLDTWFSSWLWPLTTLGWPEETDDLKRFYPTDFMLTGYDIIFFWVARMVIAGYEFRNATPFRECVFTGLIRDEHGKKMSKSMGNAIDPLDVIKDYGRDSLRFTLTQLSFSGSQDINFTPARLQGSRYFMNKLWNAAKFVLSSLGNDFTPSPIEEVLRDPARTLPDKWIVSRLLSCVHRVDNYFKNYDFGQAATVIYDFVWSEFCDWYLEISKFHLGEKDLPERKQLVRSLLYHILETILKLLHPISPYITEEIHLALHLKNNQPGVTDETYVPLIVESWPCAFLREYFENEKAEQEFNQFMEIVRATRNLRKSVGLPDSRMIPSIQYQTGNKALLTLIKETSADLARLIRVERLVQNTDPLGKPPEASISSELFNGDFIVFLPLEGSVDLQKEIERLKAELLKKSSYRDNLKKKLNNPDFSEKAPPKVLEKEREKLLETEKIIEELDERLRVFRTIKN